MEEINYTAPPQKSGVYAYYGTKHGSRWLVYIGETENIAVRLRQHKTSDDQASKCIRSYSEVRIYWREVPPIELVLVESMLLKNNSTVCNQRSG